MIGGFLGAGKTTAILQIAKKLRDQGLRVGLITNDQSYGLVDTAMLGSHGFAVEEITGGCFCCRFNSLVAAADKHGLYCMFTPLSECQWTQDNINRNAPEKWLAYGRFLGRRYKDRANIIWQLGNDHINVKAQHAIVQGLKEAGDKHLMTVNWRPGYHKLGSAWVRKHEHGETWI